MAGPNNNPQLNDEPILDVKLCFNDIAAPYGPFAKGVDKEAREAALFKAFNTPTPIKNRELENIFSNYVNFFSLTSTDKSSSARKARKALSEQAREILIRNAKMKNTVEEKLTEEGLDVAGLQRQSSYMLWDLSEESMAFNRQLVNAYHAKDGGRQWTDTLCKAMQDRLNAAGISSLADLDEIVNLDDAHLMEKYELLAPLMRFGVESEGFRNLPFTEEQKKLVDTYSQILLDLQPILTARMEIIANPHYETLDPHRFENLNTDSLRNDGGDEIANMADTFAERGDPRQYTSPLVGYLTAIHNHNAFRGNAMWNYACRQNPELKGAVLGGAGSVADPDKVIPGSELSSARPLVATTEKGDTYVITNDLPRTIHTRAEYMDNLSALAKKADKWLLTGSRQFKSMMDSLQRGLLNNSLDSASHRLEAESLLETAKAYLEYKGVQAPYGQVECVNMGKNRREQSRIDIASQIYNFAVAHSCAMRKHIQLQNSDLAVDEINKVELPRHEEAMRKRPQHDPENINNFFANVTEFGKAMYLDNDSPFTREEATLLALLACGNSGGTVNINTTTEDGLSITSVTLNNDHFSRIMSTALYEGREGRNFSQIQGIMTSMPHQLSNAVNSGDYSQLGYLLAQGIKATNRLLQDEKLLSDKFTAYAKLNEKALAMLEKHPPLKEAAEKYLTQTDLKIARSASAISELRVKGVQCRDNLIQKMQEDPNFKPEAKDLALVCQMYGVSAQFAAGTANLRDNSYGTVPNLAENITNTLADSKPLTDYLNKSNKTILNSMKDPGDILSDLYSKALHNPKPEAKQDGIQKQADLRKSQTDLQQNKLDGSKSPVVGGK